MSSPAGPALTPREPPASGLPAPLVDALIAAVAVAAASIFRYELRAEFGDAPPFVAFALPVIAVAYLRGRRGGFIATFLSAIAGWFVIVPPPFQWSKGSPDLLFRAFTFIVGGALISILFAQLRAVQSAASRSETRFRNTFHNAAVGMAHVSLDGRWLLVNNRFSLIFGPHPPPWTVLARDAVLAPLLSGQRPSCRFEQQFRHPKGDVVWVQVTVSLEYDEHAAPEHYIAVIEDISNRKAAEEALRLNLEQLQATFTGMVEPALLAAPNGRIIATNEAYLEMLGLTEVPTDRSDLLRQMQFLDGNGQWVPEERSPFLRALKGEVTRNEELVVRLRTDGRTVHTMVGAAPIRDADGRVIAAIITAHDVTEQKRAAQALESSNNVLRQFAYAAAHDLQEPLRNIALASELLNRRYASQLEENARDLLETNIDGARRMHQMVRDLLEYSKVVDSSQAEAAPFDSGRALDSALANLQQACEEASAEVTRDPLPEVRVHEIHLVQLFQNLISNSLKYRQPAVPPLIHVSAERTGATWTFHVRDNGIGFDVAHSTRIFGLFKRLHDRTQYPGTGIGLALCSRIVERYGGRIWATAQENQGATFSFTLPAAQ